MSAKNRLWISLKSNSQRLFCGHFRILLSRGGQFFGTTVLGGASSRGIVYSLTMTSNNRWAERVLYSFSATGDVSNPYMDGFLVIGPRRELYGCGSGGGSHIDGGIFSLTPPVSSSISWTENVLYNFGDQPGDPNAALSCGITLAPTGSIFGTTSIGGNFNAGAFFQLTPPVIGQGVWTETVLHSFGPNAPVGASPGSPPLRRGGIYYGTNSASTTTAGYGTAYEFTP